MGSPCCIAAACSFHYLYHSHATLYSLFSAMLLPELHLAIFHQPSDSRLFFLCFLNFWHSSTVIPFSAQGTIPYPSVICFIIIITTSCNEYSPFYFHSKEGSWIKMFFANSSPPIPNLKYSCSLVMSSLSFSQDTPSCEMWFARICYTLAFPSWLHHPLPSPWT